MVQYYREQVSGNWFGISNDNQDAQYSESAQFGLDGSFEFTFLTLDCQGKITEQVTQYGDWGLVGDIHFTITKSELIEQEIYDVDLANEDNYHAYQVLQLTPSVFEYQDIRSKEVFMLRRVTDNIGHC